jgi:hypothetical protein
MTVTVSRFQRNFRPQKAVFQKFLRVSRPRKTSRVFSYTRLKDGIIPGSLRCMRKEFRNAGKNISRLFFISMKLHNHRVTPHRVHTRDIKEKRDSDGKANSIL